MTKLHTSLIVHSSITITLSPRFRLIWFEISHPTEAFYLLQEDPVESTERPKSISEEDHRLVNLFMRPVNLPYSIHHHMSPFSIYYTSIALVFMSIHSHIQKSCLFLPANKKFNDKSKKQPFHSPYLIPSIYDSLSMDTLVSSFSPTHFNLNFKRRSRYRKSYRILVAVDPSEKHTLETMTTKYGI